MKVDMLDFKYSTNLDTYSLSGMWLGVDLRAMS